MALLSLKDVSISFGGPPLAEKVNLQLDRGERLCLIGRNGTGKSTLMKIMAGELRPDTGEVYLAPGERVARLKQEVPEGLSGTVRQIVEGEHPEPDADWEYQLRVDRLLQEIELPPDARFEDLSAGLKRRVMLAHGLVENPALLLLDEPTNHLDIESIAWLEKFLLGFPGAILFVTHDRTLVRRLATRIIELDRGRLTGWSCDYDTFLQRKEAVLEAEAKQDAVFDKKLLQEEAWLRQGVKARRTRNEGRVRALMEMRKQRQARRELVGQARMAVQEADRSGVKVIEAEAISFAYDSQPVVCDFSTIISRGDKVGIVGPNGAGKSTLLRLLLGQLQPQSGELRLGTRLEIAYFDQLREQLDEQKSVRDNIADGSDTVYVDGVARHVIGYLQDFLFTPDRARSPVKSLSGGERNRLLLARLFTRPANLLVLDEPTNDLDLETLELLETLLVDYSGTLLLVSHDRSFLDNVVTSLLVFEGGGRLIESVGGYHDYLRQRPAPPAAEPAKSPPRPTPAARPRKLTNRERRDLESLPGRIEELEQEQQTVAQALADPALYQSSPEQAAALQARLRQIEAELDQAFRRWEELEKLRAELDAP